MTLTSTVNGSIGRTIDGRTGQLLLISLVQLFMLLTSNALLLLSLPQLPLYCGCELRDGRVGGCRGGGHEGVAECLIGCENGYLCAVKICFMVIGHVGITEAL